MAAGTTGTTDTYNEREAAVNADIQEEGTTDTHDEKETAVNTDTQEEWMEEDLREFEEVGERFLRWHKDAGSNLRSIYTGASRTTIWRQDKEKKKHEEHVKEMKMIDMFFQPVQTALSTPPSSSFSGGTVKAGYNHVTSCDKTIFDVT